MLKHCNWKYSYLKQTTRKQNNSFWPAGNNMEICLAFISLVLVLKERSHGQ